MASREPQESSGAAGPHLLLYDGECGLCNGLVQAVLARDPRGVFHFAPLQSAAASEFLARFGRDPSDLNTFVAIVNYRRPASACLTKARAAIFVMTTLGGPWNAAALLRPLPAELLDRVYDLIARNRHRFFRRVEHCVVPRPEHRGRFL